MRTAFQSVEAGSVRSYDSWVSMFDPKRRPPFDVPRSGIDGFAEDMNRTVDRIMRGRSLVYVRALNLLSEIVAGPAKVEAVIAGLEQAWGKKSFNIYYHRPLLILAALRAEAMAVDRHPLARALATESPDALAVTRETLLKALSPGRIALWCALATRTMQTNDVSRAVVWKWPAALAGCNSAARPLGLVDVGASGGLNLIADRLPLAWDQSNGARVPVVINPDVCLRVGFDIRPLDFRVDSDLAWARACIWAGDVHRMTQFDRAVSEWRASDRLKAPPVLRVMNATFVASRLTELLARVPNDGLLIVYQSLVRDYIETDKQGRYEEAMRRWIAGVPRGRAAWIELEAASGARARPSFDITAHVPDGHGGVRSLTLASTTSLPTMLDVQAQSAAEFSEATVCIP
jgi:hypothetical protein